MDGMESEKFVQILKESQFPIEYTSNVVKLWTNLVIVIAGVYVQSQKATKSDQKYEKMKEAFDGYCDTLFCSQNSLTSVLPVEFTQETAKYTTLLPVGHFAPSKTKKVSFHKIKCNKLSIYYLLLTESNCKVHRRAIVEQIQGNVPNCDERT